MLELKTQTCGSNVQLTNTGDRHQNVGNNQKDPWVDVKSQSSAVLKIHFNKDLERKHKHTEPHYKSASDPQWESLLCKKACAW